MQNRASPSAQFFQILPHPRSSCSSWFILWVDAASGHPAGRLNHGLRPNAGSSLWAACLVPLLVSDGLFCSSPGSDDSTFLLSCGVHPSLCSHAVLQTTPLASLVGFRGPLPPHPCASSPLPCVRSLALISPAAARMNIYRCSSAHGKRPLNLLHGFPNAFRIKSKLLAGCSSPHPHPMSRGFSGASTPET